MPNVGDGGRRAPNSSASSRRSAVRLAATIARANARRCGAASRRQTCREARCDWIAGFRKQSHARQRARWLGGRAKGASRAELSQMDARSWNLGCRIAKPRQIALGRDCARSSGFGRDTRLLRGANSRCGLALIEAERVPRTPPYRVRGTAFARRDRAPSLSRPRRDRSSFGADYPK